MVLSLLVRALHPRYGETWLSWNYCFVGGISLTVENEEILDQQKFSPLVVLNHLDGDQCGEKLECTIFN